MPLTVEFALGTETGLLVTHRSEEPEGVKYYRKKEIIKFTCIKLNQIVWVFDEKLNTMARMHCATHQHHLG